MSSRLSTNFTLWISRGLIVLVAALHFAMPALLRWYAGIRPMPWQVLAAILAAFYLCGPVVLYALSCVAALAGNILKEQVFVSGNVRYLRRVRWCCAWVSLVCLPAAFLYPPLIFMTVIMAFLALTVSVVKNVMAAAVELREENDLTV